MEVFQIDWQALSLDEGIIEDRGSVLVDEKLEHERALAVISEATGWEPEELRIHVFQLEVKSVAQLLEEGE